VCVCVCVCVCVHVAKIQNLPPPHRSVYAVARTLLSVEIKMLP